MFRVSDAPNKGHFESLGSILRASTKPGPF